MQTVIRKHDGIDLSGLQGFHGFSRGEVDNLPEILVRVKAVDADPVEELLMHGTSGRTRADNLVLQVEVGPDSGGCEGVRLAVLKIKYAHAAHLVERLLVRSLSFEGEERINDVEHSDLGLARIEPVDVFVPAAGSDGGNLHSRYMLGHEVGKSAAYGVEAPPMEPVEKLSWTGAAHAAVPKRRSIPNANAVLNTFMT